MKYCRSTLTNPKWQFIVWNISGHFKFLKPLEPLDRFSLLWSSTSQCSLNSFFNFVSVGLFVLVTLKTKNWLSTRSAKFTSILTTYWARHIMILPWSEWTMWTTALQFHQFVWVWGPIPRAFDLLENQSLWLAGKASMDQMRLWKHLLWQFFH